MIRRTEGWLLGGRVRHHQAADGHRTGLEPVLLAAAIPARAGERVLEGGTGSGAALLCLAARVPGLAGLGIERDAGTADLTAARPEGPFDHAFANPPWHDPAGTASPTPTREAARRAAPGLFAAWAAALAAPLRHHGTLTFITAAAALPACLVAVDSAGCGSPDIMPLWPKPGREARLVLVRARKHGHGACRVLPGLTLHRQSGGFTAAADAILRDGAALVF